MAQAANFTSRTGLAPWCGDPLRTAFSSSRSRKHAISRLRGIFKPKPGEKSLAEEWTEHTAVEKKLEEAATYAAQHLWSCLALLAFLRGEPGEEEFAEALEHAGLRDEPLRMTEVGYAEVKYIVLRKEGTARWQEQAPTSSGTIPIAFQPATRELADLAADFIARYKLSLADAFAAALAKERKAGLLVAGDPRIRSSRKGNQDCLVEMTGPEKSQSRARFRILPVLYGFGAWATADRLRTAKFYPTRYTPQRTGKLRTNRSGILTGV